MLKGFFLYSLWLFLSNIKIFLSYYFVEKIVFLVIKIKIKLKLIFSEHLFKIKIST